MSLHDSSYVRAIASGIPRCLHHGVRFVALFALGAACRPAVDPAQPPAPDLPAHDVAQNPDSVPFDPERLPPLARGAHRRLSTSKLYGSIAGGFTGEPVQPALDVAVLLRGEHRAALIDLVHNAEPGGTLWALRALGDVDPETHRDLARELADDDREVNLLHGCLASDSTVAQAIADDAKTGHASTILAGIPDTGADPEWIEMQRTNVKVENLRRQLREPASLAAFEALLAAPAFGDASSPLTPSLLHLVEHETSSYYLGLALLDQGTPPARLWGAAMLAHVRPGTYAVLRPGLASRKNLIACDHGGEEAWHGPGEALELHVDAKR